MKPIKLLNVLVATIASTGMMASFGANNSARADISDDKNTNLSQLFVGEQRMMTTYGRGVASAPADTAEIRLYFNRPETYMDDGTLVQTEPMTREELQPIVEALVAAGLAAEDIEVELESSDAYYYGSNGASILVTLAQPKQSEIDRIQRVGEEAGNSDNFYYNGSSDFCDLDDVRALENEARLSAIEDAQSRIDAMAAAVGVRVTDVLSMAEFHSYIPLSTSCYPPDEFVGSDSARPEVEIELGVLMTYGIR